MLVQLRSSFQRCVETVRFRWSVTIILGQLRSLNPSQIYWLRRSAESTNSHNFKVTTSVNKTEILATAGMSRVSNPDFHSWQSLDASATQEAFHLFLWVTYAFTLLPYTTSYVEVLTTCTSEWPDLETEWLQIYLVKMTWSTRVLWLLISVD